ncbi:MAG: methyltransferase domain-containing protein [Candidatus Parcubacteria bacterium]|nr:methyltransferase domain-containing protein [Candidatus Parcubacteria bacterium]
MTKMPSFHLVSKFYKKIPLGASLDIGTGKGKNAIFLAENEFKVDAIDINEENIKNIKQIAENNKLSIKALVLNMIIFKYPILKYSLILAIQCLNFIKKSEFEILIEKIKKSLIKDGILIISVFNTDDPSYKKLIKKHKPKEENTFYSKQIPHWWHFFGKNELKNYFDSKYKILYYKNKMVKDKKPSSHSHGITEMVIKKLHE